MVYGLGASVVILGALFKILHWELPLGAIKLGGGTLLAIGLITEAIIFAISAFNLWIQGMTGLVCSLN